MYVCMKAPLLDKIKAHAINRSRISTKYVSSKGLSFMLSSILKILSHLSIHNHPHCPSPNC